MSQILHNKKFRFCLECIPHGKLDMYIKILDKDRIKRERKKEIRYPIWIWIMIKGFMLDYKKYYNYVLKKSLCRMKKLRDFEIIYEGVHNPRIVSASVVHKFLSLWGTMGVKIKISRNGHICDSRSKRVIEYNGGFVGVYDTSVNKLLSEYKLKNKRRSIVVNTIDNNYLKKKYCDVDLFRMLGVAVVLLSSDITERIIFIIFGIIIK